MEPISYDRHLIKGNFVVTNDGIPVFTPLPRTDLRGRITSPLKQVKECLSELTAEESQRVRVYLVSTDYWESDDITEELAFDIGEEASAECEDYWAFPGFVRVHAEDAIEDWLRQNSEHGQNMAEEYGVSDLYRNPSMRGV